MSLMHIFDKLLEEKEKTVFPVKCCCSCLFQWLERM